MKKFNIKTNQKAVAAWALIAGGAGFMIYNSDDPMSMLSELVKLILMM